MAKARVLSGMRATGELHLGHYHGVLKNWLALQNEYECVFFVADWHALTTHYANHLDLETQVKEMVLAWLSVGIDPKKAHIAIQSHIPEHAVLHLLLSMITPLSWLERVPTYKDQQQKLQDKDLSTYGFLGYPLLQAADILIYKANAVPVGEDQAPHVEFAREMARRFNHLYGKDKDFEAKAQVAVQKLGKRSAKAYMEACKGYQEKGDLELLAEGQAIVQSAAGLNEADQERLLGYLEGTGKIILPEPQVLLTPASKMPGLDGQKMSKSYHNTIPLTAKPDEVEQKIKTMPTDPARVRRTDPGTPEKCPVWSFHEIYSNEETKAWVQKGCTTAGIGCLECKRPIIDAINKELAPIQARRAELEAEPGIVHAIVSEGTRSARNIAQETLKEVNVAMGLHYSSAILES
ncbi:MAG: tryptophan--tRNA ligase [Gammaproteobacteria bacterium]